MDPPQPSPARSHQSVWRSDHGFRSSPPGLPPSECPVATTPPTPLAHAPPAPLASCPPPPSQASRHPCERLPLSWRQWPSTCPLAAPVLSEPELGPLTWALGQGTCRWDSAPGVPAGKGRPQHPRAAGAGHTPVHLGLSPVSRLCHGRGGASSARPEGGGPKSLEGAWSPVGSARPTSSTGCRLLSSGPGLGGPHWGMASRQAATLLSEMDMAVQAEGQGTWEGAATSGGDGGDGCVWRAARGQAEVRGRGSLGSLQFGGFQEAVWAGALRMDVRWVWPGAVEVLTSGWTRRGRLLAWGASERRG